MSRKHTFPLSAASTGVRAISRGQASRNSGCPAGDKFETQVDPMLVAAKVLSSAAPLTEDQLQYKDKAQEERLLGSIISNRYPY